MATPANNFEKLVDVYATEIQALENAIEQILLLAHLDSQNPLIVGAQLDGTGQVLGIARQGLADAEYRVAQAARILINKSTGTAAELIAIVETLLDGASTVTYEPDQDNVTGFEITIDDPLPAPGVGEVAFGVQLGLAVRISRAAGMNGYVIYQQLVDSSTFAFDGANSARFDTGGYGLLGAAG